METTQPPYNECQHCGNWFDNDLNFCSKCGKAKVEVEVKKFEFSEIAPAITYYVVSLVILLIYSASSLFEDNLESELFITAIIIVVTSLFALQNGRAFWQSLSFKNFRFFPLIKMLVIASVGAVVVNFFADWMNFALFDEQFYFESNYFETDYPLVVAIMLVCVQPALFEEFAFRGFMFNVIQKSGGTSAALIVTSFLFAILHLSILGLFWLLPLGLLFGYFRAKYGTIWYGVFGHFCYNLIITLFEFSDNPLYNIL